MEEKIIQKTTYNFGDNNLRVTIHKLKSLKWLLETILKDKYLDGELLKDEDIFFINCILDDLYLYVDKDCNVSSYAQPIVLNRKSTFNKDSKVLDLMESYGFENRKPSLFTPEFMDYLEKQKKMAETHQEQQQVLSNTPQPQPTLQAPVSDDKVKFINDSEQRKKIKEQNRGITYDPSNTNVFGYYNSLEVPCTILPTGQVQEAIEDEVIQAFYDLNNVRLFERFDDLVRVLRHFIPSLERFIMNNGIPEKFCVLPESFKDLGNFNLIGMISGKQIFINNGKVIPLH